MPVLLSLKKEKEKRNSLMIHPLLSTFDFEPIAPDWQKLENILESSL
jgi:hypothetical protein